MLNRWPLHWLFHCMVTKWTWVWVDSRSWWWTGRPGMLWFMGSQRVRCDWVTELNWNNREGAQPHPSTENWIKDLLIMALPTHQNKTQFLLQSVSPIRKLPLGSYPSSSDGKQTENHNHRKLTILITQTTALSNSVKLWAKCVGPPRWMDHGGKFWQNVVHWRSEWQTISVFLPWNPHEQYEKAKR